MPNCVTKGPVRIATLCSALQYGQVCVLSQKPQACGDGATGEFGRVQGTVCSGRERTAWANEIRRFVVSNCAGVMMIV